MRCCDTYGKLLLVGGAAVLIFVCFAISARSAFADGSPKELKPVSDEITAKIEAAAPEKATTKPAKARKVLVFWLCRGYYHESIPVANKAIEVMGKKTGAYDAVFSDDMNMFDAKKLAEGWRL